MQIKTQLGKLNFTVPLSEIITSQQHANDLQLLAITTTHIYALAHLPNHHRDPCDRLLVAMPLLRVQWLSCDLVGVGGRRPLKLPLKSLFPGILDEYP